MIVLEPYVQLEDEFVDCFMTSPRTTSYERLFSSKKDNWKAIHPEGSLLGILQEVRVQICFILQQTSCN